MPVAAWCQTPWLCMLLPPIRTCIPVCHKHAALVEYGWVTLRRVRGVSCDLPCSCCHHAPLCNGPGNAQRNRTAQIQSESVMYISRKDTLPKRTSCYAYCFRLMLRVPEQTKGTRAGAPRQPEDHPKPENTKSLNLKPSFSGPSQAHKSPH